MLRGAGLILNTRNKNAVQCAETAKAFLGRHGIACFNPQTEPDHPLIPDVIVTFGGDGTLLIGAKYALKYDAPLLGINLGTVGFLTEEDPDHLEDALKRMVSQQYQIEERTLLSVKNIGTGNEFLAMNDVVITRGGYARLIRVDAFINQSLFGSYTSDGMIVATPTGSTGYSLSAGGPIVEPSLNCMVVTPVCPHSMQHCPCVVSGESNIRLLLHPEREQTAELQIDGQNMESLSAGDEIHVTCSERRIRLIRLREYDFFVLVRKKLSEWGT